jgi:hypothetical protein
MTTGADATFETEERCDVRQEEPGQPQEHGNKRRAGAGK